MKKVIFIVLSILLLLPAVVSAQDDGYSNVQKEFILNDGYYTAGIDLPSGKCDIFAISGSGNLSSSNMFNGGVNAMFGADDLGTGLFTDSFKGLRFPKETILNVSGGLEIKVVFTSIDTSFTPRVYDDTKAITLTPGHYDAGTDFSAGVYNIALVSGMGNVSSSNMFDGGINAVFGTGITLATQSFNNIDLKEGVTLSISGTTIKLIPETE